MAYSRCVMALELSTAPAVLSSVLSHATRTPSWLHQCVFRRSLHEPSRSCACRVARCAQCTGACCGTGRVFRCSVRANLLVLADIAMVQCERVVEFGLFVEGAGPSPVGCAARQNAQRSPTDLMQKKARRMRSKPGRGQSIQSRGAPLKNGRAEAAVYRRSDVAHCTH